ncbi:hypothetical protein [Phycicoccus avicenniae]|uniref:hypothetical protein n=1 Tax=Phycicoccus avicenniae TaxID=2828860 RepID=UPI003461B29D
MPGAVALASPKLLVMSERTTPDCSRTSAPFEPSPGYGPAVSSGISTRSVAASPDVLPAAGVAAADDPDPLEAAPHAASAPPATPMPRTARARRRSSRVPRSKASP